MRFTRSLHLPVSAAELFAWHERPGAFARLSPPWQRVRVLHDDGSIRDGARVVLDAPVAPLLPRRWEIVHRDYVAGVQFRDVLVRGPFARWAHLHRVDPDGPHASTLTDDIELALPFGPLGALGAPIARAELARLFRFRHAVTAADLARHSAHADEPRLTVAVTGATGLVGGALVPFLTTGGHAVVRVGRGAPQAPHAAVRDVQWDPAAARLDPAALEGVDAVVHLAGASVADRWTAQHKRAIRDSRVQGTRLIAETIARLARPPRVLVSASAVGFYGDRGDQLLDETAPRGRGFLADVAAEWEAATEAAERAGIRVVHARFGILLSARGGALPRLMLPFQLGAGGPIGGGQQWMGAIALDDAVGAVHHALLDARVRGPMNVALPEPVRQADFARTLAHVLHRPALVPTPAFALRLALGREQADEMILASQRVVPRVLQETGFRFQHPTLEAALRFELGR